MNTQFLMRILQRCRRLYWWLFRPLTIGVRAILIDNEDKILLVKHTYQPGWYLPGGKILRNESLWDGLKRELMQEAGITANTAGRILGVYSNFSEYKSDHITVFVVTDWSMANSSHFEIAEKRFFDTNNLPPDCSPATRRRVEEYLKGIPADFRW